LRDANELPIWFEEKVSFSKLTNLIAEKAI